MTGRIMRSFCFSFVLLITFLVRRCLVCMMRIIKLKKKIPSQKVQILAKM